uniref:Nuclear factor related to kappa-B-binding protein second winged helix domain-containing protein n=1 Tax=Anopheles epiroticus TaxID=199890 RepID=A0A182PVA1_9DIPT
MEKKSKLETVDSEQQPYNVMDNMYASSSGSDSEEIIGSKHLPSTTSFSPSSSVASTTDACVALNESTAALQSGLNMSIVADDDGSISERSVTPPPPLFPTDWSVRKATDEEIRSFREQEKRRYENPHMAFTYKQHSYDSVVGPVKGIYTQAPGISKARGHSMLVANRPNFVTILTLVRDATARLPNGEGTRADICELLKSSQYISPTATDQILQTIVSGALDRMHTEHDPCVKYDAKRKIWIYLHRNRTEQEFERCEINGCNYNHITVYWYI